MELIGGARFNDDLQKQAYGAYLEAAVEIPGPELATLCEAARDLGVFVYLGTTERGTGSGRGTVFCTLVGIDPAAGIVSTHRKLMPTYEERLVWGRATATGCECTTSARLVPRRQRADLAGRRATRLPAARRAGGVGDTDYCRGGSAVAAPDGTWLVEPVVGEERLVIANLDLGMVARERQNFDPTGHYSRPDVFRVEVDRQRRTPVHFHG